MSTVTYSSMKGGIAIGLQRWARWEGIIYRKCRIILSPAIVRTIGFAKSQFLCLLFFPPPCWADNPQGNWSWTWGTWSLRWTALAVVALKEGFFVGESLFYSYSHLICVRPRKRIESAAVQVEHDGGSIGMHRFRGDLIIRSWGWLYFDGQVTGEIINDCFRQGETQTHYGDGRCVAADGMRKQQQKMWIDNGDKNPECFMRGCKVASS